MHALKMLEYRPNALSRDAGRVYVLIEMPAAIAEKWATRFLCALMNHSDNLNLPAAYMISGMSGLFTAGLPALRYLPFSEVEPLMDILWKHCVKIYADPKAPSVEMVRDVLDNEIADWQTRVAIRKALIGLHFDFSEVAAPYLAGKTATESTTSSPPPSSSESTKDQESST